MYSNATFSCLPGQGFYETPSAYYERAGGLRFSEAIVSTESLAWSDNEDQDVMNNGMHVLSYCTGARLPSAKPVSHNVVVFSQQSTSTQFFSARSRPEQIWRESIEPLGIHHNKAPECSSRLKSSSHHFWHGLLQRLLPCIKFQK